MSNYLSLVLEEGKVYSQLCTGIDSACLMPSAQGIDLIIAYKTPKEEETRNFKDGDIQIKTVTIDDIPFLFFRFGCLPWMEVPFVPCDTDDRLPNVSDCGFLMHILLADSKTGKLLLHRVCSMSPQITKAFQKDCDNLVKQKLTPEQFDDKFTKIKHRYSNRKALMALINDTQ